jgi:hypothetical protein
MGRGSSRSRSRRRSEIECGFDAVVKDVCLDGGDKGIVCLEQFPLLSVWLAAWQGLLRLHVQLQKLSNLKRAQTKSGW